MSKEKKINRLLGVLLFIAIVTLCVGIGLMGQEQKYSVKNMAPGEKTCFYILGEGVEKTGIIVQDVYKKNKPFKYNYENYNNAVMIDAYIYYEDHNDYYYWLFCKNEEVEYLFYDSDSKKHKPSDISYIRDMSGQLKIILEADYDISNIKWVRIFGINKEYIKEGSIYYVLPTD